MGSCHSNKKQISMRKSISASTNYDPSRRQTWMDRRTTNSDKKIVVSDYDPTNTNYQYNVRVGNVIFNVIAPMEFINENSNLDN